MAIALAQPVVSTYSGLGGGSIAVAFGSNVTLGNCIIVGAYCGGNSNTCTITDTRSNSYTSTLAQINQVTDVHQIFLHAAYNISGGADTVTATFGGTPGNDMWIGVWEWSGLALSAAFDKSSTATGTGTAVDSGNTATTSQADELLVGIIGFSGVGLTATPGASYTERLEIVNPSPHLAGYLEDRVVSATGAYNATCTPDASHNWSAIIGTFKAAAVAAGALPQLGRNIFVMP